MSTRTRFSLVILLLFIAFSATACTTAWTQEAVSIINLLVPAIEAALGILAAFGVAKGLSPKVMDDVRKWAGEATSDLQTVIKPLIEQYNSAEASARPGILNDIQHTFVTLHVGPGTFLPVRSDPERIMTCVLEYETDHVLVNDLIYVRQGDAWIFHKSAYRKLRLGVEPVLRELRELGFAVQRSQAAGALQAIVATK